MFDIIKSNSMRTNILTLLIMMISVVMSGQTSEKNNALDYQRNGKLDLAKEAIDRAVRNEETLAEAKTWFYRGNIYYDIAVSTDPAFRELDPDPFGVAFQSYQKARELDTNGEYTEYIDKYTKASGEGYYNNGVLFYNDQKYNQAAACFENAFNIAMSLNLVDTAALINAAVMATLGNETQKAVQYYRQLIQIGVSKPDLYASLSEIYKAEGDTAMALNTVLKGRALFPEDYNLLIAETNIYLSTNENERALNNLEEAIKIDNTNPAIFFAAGTVYDQMGDVENAITAYDNAIKLNPDYFEANYNIGALYVNQAANILDRANDLPLDAVKEYDAAKAEADDMLKTSLPFLEKAHELMPDDLSTIVSLNQIYTRLGMTDKLMEMSTHQTK
jgi:tetratricopeptide (TPR) repeat protein